MDFNSNIQTECITLHYLAGVNYRGQTITNEVKEKLFFSPNNMLLCITILLISVFPLYCLV